MDSTVSKQVALLKFKDALDALAENKSQAKIVFAPDIIRDVGLSEPAGKDLALELAGREKDRLGGFSTFMRGGGHAMLGANAAMALRGLLTEAVDVSILAKVYPKDRWELVTQYLVNNPAERGIAQANAEFVLNDHANPKRQAVNVVLARKRFTTIVLGEQPKLGLGDYSEEQRERVLDLLNSADIVAVLSLKSKFMSEMLDLCEKGELRTPELFCDCTSGDDMELNYRMLDTLRGKGASGSSAIKLLSINENEVLLFEMLLRREAEREDIIKASKRKGKLVADLDKVGEDGPKEKEAEIRAQIGDANKFVESGQVENPFEAARVLYERIGVPLLIHTKEGAHIIGGEKTTGFVPSVQIDFPAGSSFVGAGDTLCGAFATALAVKKRSDALLPEGRRLSYEECLLIANLATGYRLAKVNWVGRHLGNKEWYEATGKVDELYSWAGATPAKRSVTAALPRGVEFVDVEANSAAFGSFEGMDSETLLREVREKCETNYWISRAAFEELGRNCEHTDALVELVKDAGPAGIMFWRKAVHSLAERGKAGIDALAETISSMDEESAFRVVSEGVVKLKAETAAEILFRVLCTGRLTDSFEKLMELIAPSKSEFASYEAISVCMVSRNPDFIENVEVFRTLFLGEPTKSQLSEQGINLDLIYHLGLLAQKACLALDASAIKSITSRVPRQAGMDDEKWDRFEGAVWGVRARCIERSKWARLNPELKTPRASDEDKLKITRVARALGEHELCVSVGKIAAKTRKRIVRECNISDEAFNNAIILLLYEEMHAYANDYYAVAPSKGSQAYVITAHRNGHGPNYELLRLLTRPFTEAVRDFFLWYNERYVTRSDLSGTYLWDKLFNVPPLDSAVHDFYRRVLAICLIGKLINQCGHVRDSGYVSETPHDFYWRRVRELRKMMSQWPQEQPRADAANRAAGKSARIERDHFMKPMRPKRRFEEIRPERMNRMKRIV